jgi:hypothetical protein
MWRPTASSIVSHAARVGAITITRPVGGSAPTNAAWSGGRYWSLTSRMRAGWARNVRDARGRYGFLLSSRNFRMIGSSRLPLSGPFL